MPCGLSGSVIIGQSLRDPVAVIRVRDLLVRFTENGFGVIDFGGRRAPVTRNHALGWRPANAAFDGMRVVLRR